MSERKSGKRSGAKSATGATAPSRRGFSLSTAWAAGILALLVVIFFHEVVLGGKTFVSPDTTAPAGFVRIGEQSLYDDHVYPLWNPVRVPRHAVVRERRVQPAHLPARLAGGASLQKVAAAARADLDAALLLPRRSVHVPAGARVGRATRGRAARRRRVRVRAQPGGGRLARTRQPARELRLPAAHGLARVPLDARVGNWTDLGWLALAGGFQMLRGHVQICFYTWMAVGLYAMVDVIAAALRAPESGREPAPLPTRAVRAVAIVGAAAFAFGIAGFYNLPLRDYAQWSIRGGGAGGGVGMEYATGWSMAPYELPAIVVPGWVGFGGATYWGGMPFTDYPNAFVGMVAVLLAPLAWFATGWRRGFAVALASVALVISFGRYFPLYGFLYEHLPLFNKFRVPVMIILLFQLAAALGVAWGWSAVLDARDAGAERAARVSRVLLILGGALVVILVGGVLRQDVWRAGYVDRALRARSAAGAGYTAELGEMAYRAWVGDLARACFYGLAAVGLALLVVRGRLAAGIASIGVLALVLIELWPIGGKLMLPVLGDPVRRNLDVGRDDVVQFLEQAGPPGSFRILPLDEFQNNRFAGFGIASVGGTHAAKPRLIQDLIEANLIMNPDWQRLLNVRFIVTRQNVDPLPPYLRVAYSGSQNVYENLLALPRATLVDQYEVVTPARAILDSVGAGATDPARITFLEKDPGVELGSAEGGAAVISRYGLNDVIVDVDTPGQSILRLADAWYPDWTATVDGKAVPVLKADYLLRAVVVPPGKHRVEFHFSAGSVRSGFILSLVSLTLAIGILVGGYWRGRRRAAPPPAPI